MRSTLSAGQAETINYAMSTEIEAKFKVDDLEPYAEALEQLNAEFLRRIVQRDHFFDLPEGKLEKSGCGLRLRQEIQHDHSESILTFKGPREKDSSYKKRREVEFGVSDFDSARELLGALGYEQIITIEKTRSLWSLDDCSVCLDILAELGSFIEIEGPTESAIKQVAAKLNLEGHAHIQESYLKMVIGQNEK